jgi:hypothetical protein
VTFQDVYESVIRTLAIEYDTAILRDERLVPDEWFEGRRHDTVADPDEEAIYLWSYMDGMIYELGLARDDLATGRADLE